MVYELVNAFVNFNFVLGYLGRVTLNYTKSIKVSANNKSTPIVNTKFYNQNIEFYVYSFFLFILL